MEENGNWPVIGIDLGTTYSCVAIWRNESIEIISNDHGNRTTPSCVAFTNVGHSAGDAALIQAIRNPLNTIFDAKRLIGRRFTDKTVQSDMKMWPFNVIEYLNDEEAGRPAIEISVEKEYKHYLPEEISSMILVKMKEIAEAYLRLTVKNAVITVPAYFNDSQRQATKDAGKIAGLNVVKIINEPTAAAFAYGLGKTFSVNNPKKNVLIFDLGGGTFDVSLICMGKNRYEVKSVNGDTHLGGGDFNNNMVRHFAEEFKRKHNKDISDNSKALGKLRKASEEAKRKLSSDHDAPIEIDSLFEGIDFSSNISRAKFENLNMELFRKCIGLVKKCLTDAKIEKREIHDVVLVGGSTRIPKIQELLQEFFNGKDLYTTINPDEAVAHGAAVHGAFLAGLTDKKDIVLFDVVPLPMGIELVNGDMFVIVPANTIFPTEKKASGITTVEDNQTLVSIRVFEGVEQKAADNRNLGTFVLDDIPPAPKGVPNFDVSFEIDANGILKVSVEDVDTGKKNQITVTKPSSFSSGEIERMAEETKKRKAKDAEYKKKLEVKHAIETYAYDVREKLRDYEGELGIEDMKKITDEIESTISWINWNFHLMATEFEDKLNELVEYCDDFLAGISTVATPPPPHQVLETMEANTLHEMTCSISNDFLDL